MPVDTGLTDALLVKLYHLGKSDAEIAEEYEITVQAVNKRLNKMGLTRRTKPNRQVNEWLAYRWDIKASKVGGPDSHHQRYSAKRLKVWLRMRLGDDTLSDRQRLRVGSGRGGSGRRACASATTGVGLRVGTTDFGWPVTAGW